MYFWSLIVAMILFGVGGGFSLYEGIAHLGHPEVPGDPLWNYAVLGIASMVIGLILGGVALFLAYEARALLVGETITRELEASVRSVCADEEAVEEVVRLAGVHLGPEEEGDRGGLRPPF